MAFLSSTIFCLFAAVGALTLHTPSPMTTNSTFVHSKPSFRKVRETGMLFADGVVPTFDTLEDITTTANGIMMIVPVNGLFKIGDLMLPGILKQIAGTQVSDNSGTSSSFDYQLTNIVIDAFGFQHVTVGIDGGDIRFDLTGIRVEVLADWHARETIWPNPAATGKAVVRAEATAHAQFSIAMSGSTPQITTKKAVVSISGVSVHVTGSSLSIFINLLTAIFNSEMKGVIQNALQSAIANNVDTSVNTLLKGLTYKYPIAPGISLNYHLTTAPWVLPLGVIVRIVGGFETDKGVCPYGHHSLGLLDDSLDFNLIVDEYVLNSGSWAAFSTGMLVKTLSYKDMPDNPALGNPLNTSFWTSMASGLSSKYPNAGMEVKVTSTTPPLFGIKPKASNITGPVDLQFSVVTGSLAPNVFTLHCTAYASVNFTVEQKADRTNLLHTTVLKSSTALLSKCSQVSSKVGTINTNIVNIFMSIIGGALVNVLNENLKDGFPLPSPPKAVASVSPELLTGTGSFQFSSDIQY